MTLKPAFRTVYLNKLNAHCALRIVRGYAAARQQLAAARWLNDVSQPCWLEYWTGKEWVKVNND